MTRSIPDPDSVAPVPAQARVPRLPSVLPPVLLLAILAGAPSVASGQAEDYRLGEPSVTAGLHAGWGLVRGGSDLFDFTREALTVGARDLDGISLRGEVGVRLHERLDLAVGVGWSGGEVRSESRDWVDQDELPIEQTTWFNRVPVTLGGKLYLSERGRRISRFAWIPAPQAFYVGAGGGLTWYRFRQRGAFVNTETLDVFDDDFTTDGWGPSGYVAGGMDLSLGPRSFLTAEGRYSRGSAEVGYDFDGFDRIDLGGWQFSLGISVR